jgi:hypothetical protein
MIAPFLVALASLVLAAQGPAPCVQKAKGAVIAPASLDDLLSCQRQALDAAAAAYAQKNDGRLPPDELMAQWQGQQAAETQAFSKRARKKPGASLATETGALGDEDRLKADLWKKSDDGKKGVTPEMSAEITEYLNQKQGGVSPEMKDLLDSLQKDGVNLTGDSMLKLKKAARAADGEGLDLGIDQKMKQQLLDPATDPQPGSGLPGSN